MILLVNSLLLKDPGDIFSEIELSEIRDDKYSEIPLESLYENVIPCPVLVIITAASPSTGPMQIIGFPEAMYSKSFPVRMLLLL
jgi:hypothetical protein